MNDSDQRNPRGYIQNPVPVAWSGEGLPPVGTVCEVLRSNLQWYRCEIFAIRGNEALFDLDPGHADSWDSGDASLFRPIRTPEQIAAEEREKAIAEAMKVMAGSGVHCSAEACRNIAAAYVDAGYRKHDAQQLHDQRLRRLAEIASSITMSICIGGRQAELRAELAEILSHYREPQA